MATQTKLDGAALEGSEPIHLHPQKPVALFPNASTFASVAFVALCRMYLSWVCGADDGNEKEDLLAAALHHLPLH